MLPEATEIVNALLENGTISIAKDYPLSYAIFGCSFMFLIFIEIVVERCIETSCFKTNKSYLTSTSVHRDFGHDTERNVDEKVGDIECSGKRNR